MVNMEEPQHGVVKAAFSFGLEKEYLPLMHKIQNLLQKDFNLWAAMLITYSNKVLSLICNHMHHLFILYKSQATGYTYPQLLIELTETFYYLALARTNNKDVGTHWQQYFPLFCFVSHNQARNHPECLTARAYKLSGLHSEARTLVQQILTANGLCQA